MSIYLDRCGHWAVEAAGRVGSTGRWEQFTARNLREVGLYLDTPELPGVARVLQERLETRFGPSQGWDF